ncbi:hypothetical protein [Methylobacterium sp. Leaf91]|uniref:hypothetical protein n=1 Tax=Methylobacterium sp. Leaf91 TaxID=1736247 RepID=UPI0006FBBCB0|nr:hypothetical protein [Methylobacterium sp. Leaf91]
MGVASVSSVLDGLLSANTHLSQFLPQRLDLDVQLACIHRQFDALLLDLCESGAKLGILGR